MNETTIRQLIERFLNAGTTMEEERTPTTNALREILAKLGLPGITDEAIHAFTVEEDGGAYAVWRIGAGSGSYVLKRAKAFELETYVASSGTKSPMLPRFTVPASLAARSIS